MDGTKPTPHSLTETIIGRAIRIRRTVGPGLLESAHEAALCIELEEAGLRYKRQHPVSVRYKGQPVGEYRLDLLVEDAVVIEVKSVERLQPVFDAQVLTYLKATGARVGLLLNLNSQVLAHGLRRFVL